MAWIKRNLFFVLGSIVALGLMVFGIVVLLGQISQESQVAEDIGKQYAELTRLTQLNPHPGDDKIDNIKATKEQQVLLRNYITKTRPFFQRISPIPDFSTNKIDKVAFAAEMRNTVSQLQHSASNQSVLLPPDYYFTFEAQKKIMNFDPASLEPLAVHLGEIKALCDIFFDAKVNSLDSIRREVISVNNDNNPSDYLPDKTVSTPLADITPYEVTFRCFSAELAQVLGSFASSPYGFVVKTINVENASSEMPMTESGVAQPAGTPPPNMPPPSSFRAPNTGYNPVNHGYGIPPGARPYYPGAPPTAPAVAPPTRGPQEFLREKLIRVTLEIQVVKIRSAK
jgi:hypothetical protein